MSNQPAILFAIAAAMGLYLGTLYLRGQAKPTISLIHGFVGFFGLAALIVMIRGNPYIPNDPQPSRLGNIAAGLFAASLFTGLVGPLYRQTSRTNRERILIAHAAVGLTGLVVVVVWTMQQ